MAEGWIKIHRKIQDHWIWKSDRRFKWWIDILFTVNHADNKVLIGGKLIECKRGQSVMSLETWGKRWGVTKKSVKDFFMLLQNDSMLIYENIQISTRITVCNYDTYQSIIYRQETDSKRIVNGQETGATPKQECKEGIKNEKNEKIDYNKIIDAYHTTSFTKIKKLTDARKTHIQARIKEYDEQCVIDVILKASKSDFLRGNNNKRWRADLDWLINPNNFVKVMEGKYDNKKPMMP